MTSGLAIGMILNCCPANESKWALIVLTAYFGGPSLEKVARILAR